MAFDLQSSAFAEGETIPERFTCDGSDSPPPLVWSGAPPETQSFALIMDDPDAPHGTFTHWLLYDIPGATSEMSGQTLGRSLPNDFGRHGYGGPCPPPGHGVHRYVFTLHAVNVPHLTLKGQTRASLEQALHRHSIGTASLVGRYSRRGRA